MLFETRWYIGIMIFLIQKSSYVWGRIAQLFPFENGLFELNSEKKIGEIHVRCLPFWSFGLSYKKRCFCQWNQLAQLFLVFENGSFEVQHRKKTKIGEIRVRFPKNHKVSPDSSRVSESGRITRSERGERWLQSLDQIFNKFRAQIFRNLTPVMEVILSMEN